MRDISICKKCIWYDDGACRNYQKFCIDNGEYLDAADVIRNICAEEEGASYEEKN